MFSQDVRMIVPKEACKYLINFPFSPLTVAKAHNIIQYIAALVAWRTYLPQGGFFLFVLPFADIMGLALALVSLWFMVQKFYWKKLEMGMNSFALGITAISFLTLLFYPEVNGIFYSSHLFIVAGWIFCLWWSWQKTNNTVSNLFIANWGENTTDIEIEALEEHF